MCNLLKLKASQTKLPLSEKYSDMWLCINKIIDGLHLQNHKNKDCKEKLHPDKILTMHPDLKLTKNTMAAEQTFVWLSRFKKILCCMPKPHHLFYCIVWLREEIDTLVFAIYVERSHCYLN